MCLCVANGRRRPKFPFCENMISGYRKSFIIIILGRSCRMCARRSFQKLRRPAYVRCVCVQYRDFYGFLFRCESALKRWRSLNIIAQYNSMCRTKNFIRVVQRLTLMVCLASHIGWMMVSYMFDVRSGHGQAMLFIILETPSTMRGRWPSIYRVHHQKYDW